MKKLVLLLIATSTLLFTYAQNKYAEKSGKIVYHYEIGDEQTDFTLMFNNYGKHQIIDINQKVDGVYERVKTIITESEMLIVNYSDKQVIKLPVDDEGKASGSMMSGVDQGINLEALVKTATEASGSKVGKENLMGKECMVYEVNIDGNKGKYWIYKNYLLKAEFIDGGVHTFMEAKEFKMGVPIAETEFKAPANFKVTDMSQMKQMMQMFGAPE